MFRILMRAGTEGLSAGVIAERLDVAPNALSNHLGILTRAEIVIVTRQGRSLIYAARIEGVKDLLAALVGDCCDGHPEVCASLSELAELNC